MLRRSSFCPQRGALFFFCALWYTLPEKTTSFKEVTFMLKFNKVLLASDFDNTLVYTQGAL